LGENELADMNLAEYSAKLLGFKRNTTLTQSRIVDIQNTTVPSTVDWVKSGAVGAIKNQ